MNILISACLLGVNCRYNADRLQVSGDVLKLMEKHTLIPVCPEVFGGLSTPREPSEIRGVRVYAKSGLDVTDNYMRGARETLRLARLYGCRIAVLKERSPSCGAGAVYDGSFCGRLVEGEGVTALLLMNNGIRIYGESNCLEIDI